MMCTLLLSLWSQESYYSTIDTHGISSVPSRVEVISGLVRQDNLVPSSGFRANGREASKLSTEGCQNKYSWRSRRGETHEAW